MPACTVLLVLRTVKKDPSHASVFAFCIMVYHISHLDHQDAVYHLLELLALIEKSGENQSVMSNLNKVIFCQQVRHVAKGFLNNQNRQFSSRRTKLTIDPNGIARVQLNRPEKLNALDLEMFEAIAKQASDLKQDTSVRAVIISGNGRAFCTGLDVKSMSGSPLKNVDRLLERPSGYSNDGDGIGNLAQDVGYLWRKLPVPVICAMHGMCFGGGKNE